MGIRAGIAKKVMPHRLVGFAEHHDGIIAQGVVIPADNVRLRGGMCIKRWQQKGGCQRGINCGPFHRDLLIERPTLVTKRRSLSE